MQIFGQLEKAQLENTTSDTGSLPKGMITYRTDLNVPKVSNGTSMLALVDESTAQTLTNKTLTSPILTGPQITSGGIIHTQIATPSTPSAGLNKVYTKSDGNMYILGSDGIEKQIGSGGSGTGKNYLGNINNVDGNGNFELGSTTKWSLFNTTLTSKIPTGSITAGAASLTTFAAVTSGKLAGTYSLSVASSGAITAGHGFISDAVTFDLEDQVKVCSFEFSYKAVSGTMDFSGTSNNTWAVYVYDVTNSIWIQPSGVYGMTQGSGTGTVRGEFQTTGGTQYRLAVICVTATGGATSMLFDSFRLGPQSIAQGTPVTDWTTFTPTGSWSTNTTYAGKWRRVGDTMEVQYFVGLTGAPNNVSLSLNIPSGYSVDTTKLQAAAPLHMVQIRAASNTYMGTIVATGATSFIVRSHRTATGANPVNIQTSNLSATAPETFGNGDGVFVWANFPIVGWSSSVQMSQDTDTRVVGFSAYSATGYSQTTQASNTTIPFTAGEVIKDTHAGWDTSTNTYTIPVSGLYRIYMQGLVNTGTGTNRLFILRPLVNGVTINLNASVVPTSTSNSCSGAYEVELKAGDTVRPQALYDAAGTFTINETRLTVTRISGPSVVAASETVAASMTGDPASATAGNPIIFPTAEFDTHGAYNTSTGRYTAPISGFYDMGGYIGSGTSGVQLEAFVNAVFVKRVGYTDSNGEATISGLIKLNAGDLLDLRPSGTLDANANSVMNIKRIK